MDDDKRWVVGKGERGLLRDLKGYFSLGSNGKREYTKTPLLELGSRSPPRTNRISQMCGRQGVVSLTNQETNPAVLESSCQSSLESLSGTYNSSRESKDVSNLYLVYRGNTRSSVKPV